MINIKIQSIKQRLNKCSDNWLKSTLSIIIINIIQIVIFFL